MEKQLPTLEVQVLGIFSIAYDNKPLSFGRNTATKAIKLLQVLLYHSDTGIAREKLIEHLYGREELADVSNNLRVTVHRLKKLLTEAGLPEHDYISIKKGIYKWDAPMITVVDAFEMKKLIEAADTVEDETERILLLEQACRMYRGTFLPDLSGADWAIVEDLYYKNMYIKALQIVCDWGLEHEDYEHVLSLCTPACEMDPFGEWQSVKISCYIGLKQYKEAIKEYEDTSRMFIEELGVSPSKKMMDQFQKMSEYMQYQPQAIDEIQGQLREEVAESGAFCCSFPSFRDSYRLVSRIIERSGQSVFLMLCSLTNGKGQPIEAGDKLDYMSLELQRAIKRSLRRGDCFTKYSSSQFVLLLIGTNKEKCSVIFDRIQKNFCENHKSWSHHLEYYVASVAQFEEGDSKLSFIKRGRLWE